MQRAGRSGSSAATPSHPASTTVPAAAPSAAEPWTGLTEAEAVRAAELEAQIMADERAADEALRRRRDRDRQPAIDDAPARTRGRVAGGLAVQYAHEYDYVARDLRRISFLAAALIFSLFAIFALLQATGGLRA
jgi:hypothetical protein